VNIKSDKRGYFQVDLLRKGMYLATVESHENVTRTVVVPDRSSINIMYLLFPIIVDITFNLFSPTIGVVVGGIVTLTPVITATDYRTLLGTAPEDLFYSVDDPSIASVVVGQNTIVINGISAGTTSLRVTRKDRSIVYIPDPAFNGAVTTITVS